MTRTLLTLALFLALTLAGSPALADEAPAPCGPCNTDFDGDGDSDDDDLEVFKASMGLYEGEPGFDPACDCNDDGAVGVPDWACVLQALSAQP